MGSGLDLSCLTYEKVAAFIAAANRELSSPCSVFASHGLNDFLVNLFSHAGEVDVEADLCVVNTVEIVAGVPVYLFTGDATHNILLYSKPILPIPPTSPIPAGIQVHVSINSILDALNARAAANMSLDLSDGAGTIFTSCFEGDDDAIAAISIATTQLVDAELALAQANQDLADAKAVVPPVQADVDAAELAVENAEGDVAAAQLALNTAVSVAQDANTLEEQHFNWLSFAIVELFLLAADTETPSAADIPNIHWIIYEYLVASGASYPIRDATRIVCELENVKFVNGTSVDKNCEFLFATRKFRILAGALISLIGEDRDCWRSPCNKKIAYRIVRARWDETDPCRPVLERCVFVPPGVYRALRCKTLFGADEFLDAAALAAITSDELRRGPHHHHHHPHPPRPDTPEPEEPEEPEE